MAYDRPTVDTEYVAQMIKSDPDDEHIRLLVNFILAVGKDAASLINSRTVAQWVTVLDNAITKGIAP
jgi:hypothetical protein